MDLSKLRHELEAIDARLIAALAERQDVVRRVGHEKAAGNGDIRDLPREEELLGRLVEQARSAGVDEYLVTRLYREIFESSVRRQQDSLVDSQNPRRASQRLITVGFQGVEGAYSHLAARKHFASRDADIVYRGFDSFRELLEAARAGVIDYAMLPIENTTAGSINEAYDLLAQMELALVGEEIKKVDHCLLGLEPAPLTRIHRVYSHPQALAQCSEFLRSHRHWHVEAFTDTAMSARKVRDDQDLSQAAIASEEAAQIYGLCVLKRRIANQKENYTRFVVVAREPVSVDPRIPCKTSVIIATRHEEGALLAALNVFARHHLNLTKLESRPRPNTPWEYLFYLDFEGNVAEERVRDALRELAAHTNFIKVLGSYAARATSRGRAARPKRARVAATAKEAPLPPPQAAKALEKKPYRLVSRAVRAADTVIRAGEALIGGPRPIVIAGPCSVESREQIFACAKMVKESGGDALRGGCFKPRTSPYAFQGMGYEGLDLLAEAGAAYGLPIVTEVMHPADVARVAEKADILQIGARNMQNFSLLKEFGRVDRPVILKRGLMASVDEWLSAAEYILAAGNQQVILCERGIRTFETATRNTLDLSAVPVARELTHLPIVVDPSHACGVARWVPAMTDAAIASGANGVMIEIHPEPEKALSDGPQSLDFPTFHNLMERVQARLA